MPLLVAHLHGFEATDLGNGRCSKICNNLSSPLLIKHPTKRLAPMHLDAQLDPTWHLSTCLNSTLYRKDWTSASVVNSVLVTDTTSWHLGFDLSRCSCTPLNRFWTGQKHCLANVLGWVWPHQTSAPAVSDRPWTTQSTRILWQSWKRPTISAWCWQSTAASYRNAVYRLENTATTAFTKWNEVGLRILTINLAIDR